MLAALGELNSEILTGHYGSTMPPPSSMSNMARRASALKRRAIINLSTARGQHNAVEEDVEILAEAAAQRHVSRHTTQKTTLCVGPCVRIPRDRVKRLVELGREVVGHGRVDAVVELTAELRRLPPPSSSSDNPRLCVSTGMACSVAQFEESSDVRHVKRMDRLGESRARLQLAEEIAREATYTHNLVRSVGVSQVRELEVGGEGVRLGGGARAPPSTPHNISLFYKHYSLGEVPPGSDIKLSLDQTSKSFAPRARERVVRDLWLRWNKFKP